MWGLSLIFILTNPFQRYLSLSVWCAYVCVLFIYTISVTILSVLQKQLSFTESNRHTCGFYKRVILEKSKDIAELFKVSF